jgi:hypothetical protein
MQRVYLAAARERLPQPKAPAQSSPHVASMPTDPTGVHWDELLIQLDPHSYAAMGIAFAIGLSVVGAAWYGRPGARG